MIKNIQYLAIFVIFSDYISETYEFNQVEFWALCLINACILYQYTKGLFIKN